MPTPKPHGIATRPPAVRPNLENSEIEKEEQHRHSTIVLGAHRTAPNRDSNAGALVPLSRPSAMLSISNPASSIFMTEVNLMARSFQRTANAATRTTKDDHISHNITGPMGQLCPTDDSLPEFVFAVASQISELASSHSSLSTQMDTAIARVGHDLFAEANQQHLTRLIGLCKQLDREDRSFFTKNFPRSPAGRCLYIGFAFPHRQLDSRAGGSFSGRHSLYASSRSKATQQRWQWPEGCYTAHLRTRSAVGLEVRLCR